MKNTAPTASNTCWSGVDLPLRKMSPYYQSLRETLGSRLLLMPSIAAVIHDAEGRLLLIQKQDGSYSLPAGAIEPGESPEAALIREVREETGFKVTSATLVAALGGEGFRFTYPNGHEVEYTILLYSCEATADGAILDQTESHQIAFFTRDMLPNLGLPYDSDLLFTTTPG